MRNISGVLGVIFLLSISSTFGRSLSEDEDVAPGDLVVSTTTGVVRGGYGGTTVVGKKPVYWFRSIPFAEPPVGNLRFEPPVPKRKWQGVLEASEKGNECTQGSDPVRGSEDCLFLKVYTSELPQDQKKLPVMIWIYGGAFFAGSPDFSDHSVDYFLDQGVIVASFHYRVGIFGFLSTGDMVVPGNNGLKDQILALKWLKENIEAFGGDPDNITIFGQSAGGASVAYLLQTNLTQGLFNRAIMQSGVSLCLWALSRTGNDMARTVAGDLNLPTTDSAVLVDGLKSVDAAELQKAHMSAMIYKLLTMNPRDGLLFAPVMEPEHEGAVLSGASHDLIKNGNFHKIPIIIGYNSLEALLGEIPEIMRIWLLIYDVQPSRLTPIDMNITGVLARNTVGRTVKTKYFGNSLVSGSNRKVMEFISDDQFERPIQEAARLYANYAPVYFYRFAYEGALWGVTNRSDSGVGHTEELGYLFDFKYEGSDEDYRTRDRMIKLWTNFAKTGNPTPEPDPLLERVQWTPNVRGASSLSYLDIDREIKLLANPNSDKIDFWDDLYTSRGNPPFDTY